MTARDEVVSSTSRAAAGTDDTELATRHAQHVEELWRRLDPHGEELDLRGLKKGLRRIDHPMKNADEMLRQIIELVDSNGDGKIQYEGGPLYSPASFCVDIILTSRIPCFC